MKTLEEHDAERWKLIEEIEESKKPHANGIACPECGKELWDSDPMTILTSYPAQKNVHCPACGYRGYRLA